VPLLKRFQWGTGKALNSGFLKEFPKELSQKVTQNHFPGNPPNLGKNGRKGLNLK